MPTCYICGCDKSYKKMAGRLAGRPVCKGCRPSLGKWGWSAEREVEGLAEFDQATRADPHYAGRL